MKNVAILGFGMEGQDAARFFLAKGAQNTVFDKRFSRRDGAEKQGRCRKS